MSGGGWFKVHREMFESDIWADVTTFRLFIFLIGQASHEDDYRHRGMILNKGQWVRSYRKLADDLSYKEGRGFKKYSLSTIKSCVNKLVNAERISVSEVELGTLFTIVNYEKYQQSSVGSPNAVNGTTPESPNVNRTELGTHEVRTKPSNSTVSDGNVNNTPNTLNSEVRTNAELIPNEVRTNAEQYQELKHLRTKELKESTTTVENDAIVFYQNNIGLIRPIISEEILDWINDFGDEMVIESLKRAIASNKANWGYAKAILRSWHQKGIKTIEQADAESVEFQNQQQSRFGKNTEPEIQPEWFKNRGNPVEDKPEVMSDQDRKEHDEVEAMLRKYS